MDTARVGRLAALLGGVAAVLVYHALGAMVLALLLFAAGAVILLHSLRLDLRGVPRVRPLALAILACGSLCYGLQMLPAPPFAVRMAALGCGTLCLLTAILIARLVRTAAPHRS